GLAPERLPWAAAAVAAAALVLHLLHKTPARPAVAGSPDTAAAGTRRA
ncbi:hypothetical protein G3I45_30680, partial [Streptomyces sp. SID339]|nr:hypothetical protein [Streptomyces sp. SID339]